MRNLLKTIQQRLLSGQELVLVTVTASSGATPRGTGARMLVGKEGRLCGTIGGGAVEHRAEEIARQVLKEESSGRQGFSLTQNDAANLGMICGGTVEVFFHYIAAADAGVIALAQEAERKFQEGCALWLISDISKGGALSLYTKQGGFFGHDCPTALEEHLSRKPKHVLLENGEFVVEQINSPGRVYIFGGGHVAQELEPVLSRVGFRCVVLDDRPEFARRELFPTAEEVRTVDFWNIAETVTLNEEDYVCVMTRGHAYDTVVQAQILKCDPCYVGVIGSRSKVATTRKALQEEYGLPEEVVARVHSPIGLDIGAETPAEIAVSIAAQMIQVRKQRGEE